MDELKKQAEDNKHLALVMQDINYIKKDLASMNTKLDVVLEHYVRREEVEARFNRLQNEIDGRFEGVSSRVDTKLDIDKFDEHSDTTKEKIDSLVDNQKFVTRLIIGLVITALVGLVLIKTQ